MMARTSKLPLQLTLPFPLSLFVATYEVGAVYWQDATHVVLADLGGPHFRPHFYYVKLEGTW